MTDNDGGFTAVLHHDGTVKTVHLPPEKFGEKPPPRLRVGAIDSRGKRVVDIFVLTDASRWPDEAVYRYLGSVPAAAES